MPKQTTCCTPCCTKDNSMINAVHLLRDPEYKSDIFCYTGVPSHMSRCVSSQAYFHTMLSTLDSAAQSVWLLTALSFPTSRLLYVLKTVLVPSPSCFSWSPLSWARSLFMSSVSHNTGAPVLFGYLCFLSSHLSTLQHLLSGCLCVLRSCFWCNHSLAWLSASDDSLTNLSWYLSTSFHHE